MTKEEIKAKIDEYTEKLYNLNKIEFWTVDIGPLYNSLYLEREKLREELDKM